MHTTINLKSADIVYLYSLSQQLGIKPSKIVKLILKEMAAQSPLLENFNGGLCYQKDDPSYHPFHIEFSQIEYEQNFDLKKIHKFSLSLIIAIGLSLFGDSLHKKKYNTKNTGNSTIQSDFADSYPSFKYYYVSLANKDERILAIRWEKQRK